MADNSCTEHDRWLADFAHASVVCLMMPYRGGCANPTISLSVISHDVGTVRVDTVHFFASVLILGQQTP
jgi:hypothetical protein